MRLRGSLETNLRAALAIAARHQKRQIYTGMLQHWRLLVDEANRQIETGEAELGDELRALISELQAVLATRRVMLKRGGRGVSDRSASSHSTTSRGKGVSNPIPIKDSPARRPVRANATFPNAIRQNCRSRRCRAPRTVQPARVMRRSGQQSEGSHHAVCDPLQNRKG